MKTPDKLKADLVRALTKWAALYEARFLREWRRELAKRMGT